MHGLPALQMLSQRPHENTLVRVSTQNAPQRVVPARHVVVSQRPPLHQAVPHENEQRPQLLSSELRSTQRPRHSVRGAAHPAPAAHTPPLHPCPAGQARPQAPQLALEVDRSMHAPVPQSTTLPMHVMPEQSPPTQRPPQRLPQAPQLAASLVTSTQAVPHIRRGAAQVGGALVHAPPLHDCPLAQRRPQAPQFVGSVATSTQEVPHIRRGDGQVGGARVQLPPAQPWPLGQRSPQSPQFAGSLSTLVQTDPHITCGGAQPPPQRPAVQAWPLGQRLPHALQWLASVASTVSQPRSGLPEQLARPTMHAAPTTQRRATQVTRAGSTPGSRVQSLPQAPQFDGSRSRSVQKPAQRVAQGPSAAASGRVSAAASADASAGASTATSRGATSGSITGRSKSTTSPLSAEAASLPGESCAVAQPAATTHTKPRSTREKRFISDLAPMMHEA
jgi:hypothetical protein